MSAERKKKQQAKALLASACRLQSAARAAAALFNRAGRHRLSRLADEIELEMRRIVNSGARPRRQAERPRRRAQRKVG
jgi:hypothetical protein